MGWGMDLNTGRVQAHLDGLADEAAYEIGEHVLQAANQHVPIEEGTLERSGRVTDPRDGAVDVLYETPYAAVQHEDLTFNHDAGRNAKWLENAMRSERAAARRIAEQRMKL